MTETVSTIDRAISILLTVATLVALGFLAEARLNPAASRATGRVEFIEDWTESVSKVEVPVGITTGSVRVAVFTDFQCPFCRRMDSVLARLELQHPGRISRSLIHFPLPGHEHAKAAATAFECARRQGRASVMHRELYAAQDSFGLLRWVEYAKRSGAQDTIAFNRCMNQESGSSDVARGSAFGNKLRITGTPAVLVNGWLFDPSSPTAIESAVAAAVQGRSPKP